MAIPVLTQAKKPNILVIWEMTSSNTTSVQVSGHLIEAPEKERSRIARDLHDDSCQRLARLSIELEQANRDQDSSGVPTCQNLEEIRKHCSEIASDVQSLSHELHSSKLEYLA